MKKLLLQVSEGILSALAPAAEITAPRGRVTLPGETEDLKKQEAREEVSRRMRDTAGETPALPLGRSGLFIGIHSLSFRAHAGADF